MTESDLWKRPFYFVSHIQERRWTIIPRMSLNHNFLISLLKVHKLSYIHPHRRVQKIIIKKPYRAAGNEERCYFFPFLSSTIRRLVHLKTSKNYSNFFSWPPSPSRGSFSLGKYVHDDTANCFWCLGRNYVKKKNQKKNLAVASELSSVRLFPSGQDRFRSDFWCIFLRVRSF